MINKNAKKHKAGPVFWFIYVIMILVFIFSVYVVLKQIADFKQSEREFEKAAEIADIPDMSDLIDSYAPETADSYNNAPSAEDNSTQNHLTQSELYEIILKRLGISHIEALQEINPDVIGWIYVTATDTSYPIMQANDNDVYLHGSWMDKYQTLTAGSIFMDYRNNSDFSDFNTIIYGHHMRNESMFGKLKYFKDYDYWEKHPSVYIVTTNKIMRYDIFAAYKSTTKSITYQLGFGSAQSKQEFIDDALKKAKYDTGIIPTADDLILTLVTCHASDYSYRWVVQGIKAEEILRYSANDGVVLD